MARGHVEEWTGYDDEVSEISLAINTVVGIVCAVTFTATAEPPRNGAFPLQSQILCQNLSKSGLAGEIACALTQ